MDFNNFDFSNSSIIKPPTQQQREELNHNSLEEQKLILIDSRDRNINLYPKNNDFVIELDEPINDVSELELVSANMPTNAYNINEHNNRLYFFINTKPDDFNTYDKVKAHNMQQNGTIDNVDNESLYDTEGKIDRSKVFYIKLIPNYYSPADLVKYLRFNNHYVYKLSNDGTNNDTHLNKVATFFISNNKYNKYNILIFLNDTTLPPANMSSEYIFTGPEPAIASQSTVDAIKNSIIFAGDKTTYNGKSMYNYLPNSAHDILGFDSNYGFSKEFKKTNNEYLRNNYVLQLYPIPPVADRADLNAYYDFKGQLHYTDNTANITRSINGVKTVLTTSDAENAYVNISNTMASNKVNDYVLLHLPNLPTMTNKIASNNIVQNAYTKLHLGTGSTRNVFFGRIKAFTNVYGLNPTIKLSKIHIKLTDYNGNLFDFNNSNFTLTFSIMHNKQPKFYNY